jgi:hypothetical protein
VTGAEFSGVDIDLLADYVGGALAGTPEEAEVAARLATDPAWRAAYDEISGAMAAVGSQLSAWGATPEPMPGDVAARLEAALASPAADPSPIGPDLAAPARPHVVPSADRHLTAVPGDHDQPRTRAPRPDRRRRMRWAAPLAAAAGVIAFLGIGAGYLIDRPPNADDKATSSAAGAGSVENAPMLSSGPVTALPGGQILASGTDYDRSTLAQAPPQKLAKPDDGGGVKRAPSPAPALDSRASALARLRLPDALSACLNAIVAENGGGAITVQSVDYARYAGNPALVVRFTAANGRFAWASGPECGSPGSGAAKLASVPVG